MATSSVSTPRCPRHANPRFSKLNLIVIQRRTARKAFPRQHNKFTKKILSSANTKLNRTNTLDRSRLWTPLATQQAKIVSSSRNVAWERKTLKIALDAFPPEGFLVSKTASAFAPHDTRTSTASAALSLTPPPPARRAKQIRRNPARRSASKQHHP